ncbi:Fc.00g045290.m01.CDS01 [Cosmosporella sp. VM-42]
MLGHVSVFEGEFDSLFWIPVIIWVADRFLRGLRVLAFNPKFWNTRATAAYGPSSNIVRLSIPWATSYYKPAPGTYYYLHVLGGPRFWESHPFTVASVSDQGGSASKLLGEQVPLLEPNEHDSHSDAAEDQDQDSNACLMTFLIRPYDGFTSRLREMTATAWPRKVPVQVLVDGPYGHTQPLHLFDNVVFVVGGSGIVVPLTYLQVLTGAGSPRSVRIHWAVREPAFALEVLQRDIGDTLGSSNLSVEIHFTSHARDDLSDWPSQVILKSGRIDARSVILAARAKDDGGSLAVIACGPGQMADDARRTVVGLLENGVTGVEYFQESFQW